MTCTDGIYVAGERILSGDCSGPQSARAVLLHPRVEAAVLETARGGILREGLGFDACDVAVVTNISEDHVGLGGVERLEDLQQVKRVVVQSVHDGGTAVLNADDTLVAEMAGATRARVVYFGVDATSPVIMSHLAAGGACVVVQDGAICLLQGQQRTQVVALDRVPFTAGGRIPFQVQNALAAAAAAWAAGLNPATIAGALTTFRTDAATVPGRFNVLEAGGAEVVFDYAHNPAALEALGQALGALGRRHTILVVGLPGDRRDADLRRAIEATLPYTDEYVLFDQSDRRGRARGEVPRLLQACLPATVPSTCAESQTKGIALGWERLRLGARLVILAYDVDGALRQVQELAAGDDGACITPVDAQLAAPAIA
jgi:cyanophycin synthetase